MRIAVLENDPYVPAGRFAVIATARGHTLVDIPLHDGAVVPDIGTFDAVVSLGGEMGSYDEAAYPFLDAEKAFLARCVGGGVPTLGLCLGSQLLADALGGRAYLAERPEVVFEPVEPIGSPDRVVEALASGPVVRFHRDTWDPPSGAEVLAVGGGYGQVFRFGTALAVQPHPEVTTDDLTVWATSDGSASLLDAAGTDGVALVEAFTAAEAEVAAVAESFFGAWLDEAERIAGRQPDGR
ncbi:MAG: type 1 glutamine amidotransferase [Acidimicrobiia bacterium]|nr:type 1 glutamine amidotransferase [Acidimicrobiia bacterium]